MKKLSVIVPVYNVEKYLSKCLDSLINQTLKDIEIILVNDGSPDNSQSIIDEYKKKDKRIKSIIKENGGQGSARNLGLTKAKGEYISYIDSDDWIDSNMLEEMYNCAKEKDLDIVICGYNNIFGDRIEEVLVPDNLINDTLSNKNSKIFNIISPCSKIYKREYLLNSKVLFEENKVWYEDFAYSVKLLATTSKIGIVNKAMYNYLIRPNSTMNNTKILKNLDILLAVDDIVAYMKGKKIYKEYYDEVEYMAIENILISTITRIIRVNGNKKTKKEVIDKLNQYMNDNFKDFKHNKYLSYLTRNRKIIYYLILFKQYWLVALIFKIKH